MPIITHFPFTAMPGLAATVLIMCESAAASPDEFASPAPHAMPSASKPARIAFEMRGKPWNSALEWLATRTFAALN